MTKPNVTTEQAAQCLRLLEATRKPIVAADLAFMLRLPGKKETQRRHVRAIIKQLRDNGSMIVATLQGGYLLTTDESVYRDYLEGRQIDAKKVLGKMYKQKKEILKDASGQELLFDNRIPYGCATIAAG